MLHPLRYIKHHVAVWLVFILCCSCLAANAQYFELDSGRRHVTMPFKLVRNLVVIQLKINGQGPYNFVLDTGVGFMLITDPSLADSIKITSKRTVKMSGFGEGEDFEAYITPPVKVDIPGLVSNNVITAILKKDHFSLSNYAGIPIHGLLGYEFFSHLAVKISFSDSTLSVALPKHMHFYKNAVKIPISIEERKPYFTTKVIFANGAQKESKLIIDLGAGHFISMENVADKNTLQTNFINANLGVGMKGLISGSLSRISEVDLGKYKLKSVIAAFPDNDTRSLTVHRDGNLGIGLLKKFDVIFDYPDNVMYLKPNPDFRTRTEHDMSGLGYYCIGDEYNHVIINKVEPGSAGDDVGLEKDDEIMTINFKPVALMSLQQIDNIFKSQDGRVLVLGIFRDKKPYRIALTLKRRI